MFVGNVKPVANAQAQAPKGAKAKSDARAVAEAELNRNNVIETLKGDNRANNTNRVELENTQGQQFAGKVKKTEHKVGYKKASQPSPV